MSTKAKPPKYQLPHFTGEELLMLWQFTESVRQVTSATDIDLIASLRAKLRPVVEKSFEGVEANGNGSRPHARAG